AVLPLFSSYKVLLSATTFAKLWILCFIPVWIASYRTLSSKTNFKPILAAAIVGIILTGGMLRQLSEYNGNFSGFLHISKKFLGRNYILGEHPEIRRDLIKVDGNGYDGQFFYFIAWDPLMKVYHFAPGADKIVDDPVDCGRNNLELFHCTSCHELPRRAGLRSCQYSGRETLVWIISNLNS